MKKNTSKLTSIVIGAVLVFALMGLAACGSSGSGPGVTVKNQGTAQEIDHDVSIEQTTLLDIPEATIVADSISFKNDELQLDLTLTNKLDTPISMSSGTLGFSANFINNYMISGGYMHTELDPKAVVTEDVSFSSSEMRMYGISQIGEIGLGVSVSHNQDGDDISDWNHTDIHKEVLTIKTDKYDSIDMDVDTYPEAINNKALLDSLKATMLKFNNEAGFEQGGISINTIGLSKNQDNEITALIEIQNNTDLLVSVRASDISINGEMVYEGSWTGDAIAPNKIAVMDINLNRILDANDLLSSSEENSSSGLGNVSQVGIEFSVRDENSNTIISPTELEFNF